MKVDKKRIIKKYTFLFCICFIVLISIFFIIKYQVEGEKDMPYKLKEVVIKSSIDSNSINSKNLWDLELSQANDIYIYIEKDNNNKNEKIQSVSIENIKIKDYKENNNIKVLLPTGNSLKDIYENSTKDYINEKIEYIGSSIDSTENHEICENGGMIALRIYNQNIGKYQSSKDTKIIYNGSLLKKAKINEKDLKFLVSMDLVIEIDSGIKYKTNLQYEMPVDKFEESGVKTKTIKEFSDVIFRRE